MMARWRPVEKNCLYVIPDIHGQYNALERILQRILPLRFSDGGRDQIVFLGDYIDRGNDSHKVLDLLIQVKGDYPKDVFFLKGNHESMLLGVVNKKIPRIMRENYRHNWIINGGINALSGYLERINSTENPMTLSVDRISEIIPTAHIEFMQECLDYKEIDNFFFVHGGFDPFSPLNKQQPEMFYWDRALFEYVKEQISFGESLGWGDKKVIVCGHSGPNILIHPNYMMLDGGAWQKLLVAEVRSRQAYVAKPKQHRLVKFSLENTTPAQLEKFYKFS